MKKIFIALLILVSIFFIIYINKDNILKLFYPIKYSEYVEKYSKEFNVDKNLIYATIKAESNFKEKAQSRKGAMGLMQIMQNTANDIAKSLNTNIDADKILEPETNIMFGTKYISILLKKYDNIGLALAAYNAGSSNVDSWIKKNILKNDGSDLEKIPFKETNNYVRKILKDYEIYRNLY